MSSAGDFKSQFFGVLDELDANGRKDGEAMWLLGSLAARFVKEANALNWGHLKSRLDDESRKVMVKTLSGDADTLAAGGKPKAAYAARILGISLVAGTQRDPELRARDGKLDLFIDTAIGVFIQERTKQATPS